MRVVEGRATVESVDDFVAHLASVGDDHGVAVQAFDARYVVDRTHLERAVTLANRAFERGNNVARDRAVEILLYAAGRRQINQALEMGVSEGTLPVAVVVDGRGTEAAQRETAATEAVAPLIEEGQTVGDYDRERVREFFDITSAELAASDATLPELVRERVALLVVGR